MDSGDWPVLGREVEIDRFQRLLDEGGSMLVGGQSGIGKSRLLQLLQSLVPDDSFEIDIIRGTQAVTSLPFAPLLSKIPIATATDLTPPQLFRLIVHEIGRVPRVLFVDDAHLLDDASASVIAAVVELGTRCVVSARVHELASNSPLEALRRDGVLPELSLHALSRETIVDIVNHVLPGHVDQDIHDQIWKLSAGDPLFVHELVVGNLEAGTLAQENGSWTASPDLITPPSTEESVSLRLAGLPLEQLDVLNLLAIHPSIGRSTLEELAGDEGIRELVRRHLVVERRSGRRRDVAIGHPMYASVLGRRNPSRHRRSYAMLADVLDSHGARRRIDVVTTTTARLAIGAQIEPDQLLAAASEAVAFTDYQLALRLVLQPVLDDSWQAFAIAGRAAFGLQRVDEANAHFERALELSSGDEAAQLHVQLAQLSLINRTPADYHLEQAERLATTAATRRMAAMAKMAHQFAAGWPQRALETRKTLDGEDLSPVGSVHLSMLTASAYLTSGEVSKAQEELGQYRALYERSGASSWLDIERAEFIQIVADGTVDPEKAIARGISVFESLSSRGADAVSLALAGIMHVAAVAGHLGTAEAAAAQWDALAEGFSDQGSVHTGLMARAMAAGERSDETKLKWLMAQRLSTIEPINNDVLLVIPLARVEAFRGDQAAARSTLCDALDASMEQSQLMFAGLIAHQLAVLDHYDDAHDALREITNRIEGRYVVFDWLDSVEATQRGDGAALEEAAVSFGGRGFLLDAMHCAGRAARLAQSPLERFRLVQLGRKYQRKTQGGTSPILASVDSPLTAREHEIVLAAANGASNRQLAEQYSTSKRTIENHLYRALGKLETTRDDLVLALTPDRTP